MKKYLSLLVILVLMCGMIFAFTPMDKKVTVTAFDLKKSILPKNSYYIKLAGTSYYDDEATVHLGATQKLKNGKTISFTGTAYDCYSESIKATFALKSDGDKKIFRLEQGKSLKVENTIIKLEYFTVPYTQTFNEYFNSDAVEVEYCDKDNFFIMTDTYITLSPVICGSSLKYYFLI